MKVAAPKPDQQAAFEEAARERCLRRVRLGGGGEATTPRKRAAAEGGRRDPATTARGSPAKAESAGRDRRAGRRGELPRRADVLEEALEHLVRGIVDHPDDVRVDLVDNRRGQRLEVRVHPEDLGRVIGRSGRTAKALRQVIDRRRRPGRPGRRRRRPTLTAVRWISSSGGSARRTASAAT